MTTSLIYYCCLPHILILILTDGILPKEEEDKLSLLIMMSLQEAFDSITTHIPSLPLSHLCYHATYPSLWTFPHKQKSACDVTLSMPPPFQVLSYAEVYDLPEDVKSPIYH